MSTTAYRHKCHAINCNIPVPPYYLMCRRHWRQVPGKLQRAVLANYRPGQEIDKQPSPAYLKAAREAIEAVRQIEEIGSKPN